MWCAPPPAPMGGPSLVTVPPAPLGGTGLTLGAGITRGGEGRAHPSSRAHPAGRPNFKPPQSEGVGRGLVPCWGSESGRAGVLLPLLPAQGMGGGGLRAGRHHPPPLQPYPGPPHTAPPPLTGPVRHGRPPKLRTSPGDQRGGSKSHIQAHPPKQRVGDGGQQGLNPIAKNGGNNVENCRIIVGKVRKKCDALREIAVNCGPQSLSPRPAMRPSKNSRNVGM